MQFTYMNCIYIIYNSTYILYSSFIDRFISVGRVKIGHLVWDNSHFITVTSLVFSVNKMALMLQLEVWPGGTYVCVFCAAADLRAGCGWRSARRYVQQHVRSSSTQHQTQRHECREDLSGKLWTQASCAWLTTITTINHSLRHLQQ